jgi:hypothetical protein
MVRFSAANNANSYSYIPGNGQVHRPVSNWLPPVPRLVRSTGNAPECVPPEPPETPRPAGRLAKAPGRNERPMTAAALLARIGHAGRTTSYEQLRTWVVAQSVRNALQAFHGRWALDPDNPGSGEGFITDGQMRALNITIRRAVHEALRQVHKARAVAAQPDRPELPPAEQEALDFCAFQLGTIRDYMEPPGSPELEEAYKRYVTEPDVNR